MPQRNKLTAALVEILELSKNKNQGKDFEERTKHIFEAYMGRENVVHQPNGSQQSPDLQVTLDNGNKIDLEIKTSKNGKIVWNSGLPKEGGIYIYSDTSSGKVTFFLGKEVISSQERAILMKTREVNKQVSELANMQLSSIDSSWDFYARPMHNNSGKPLTNKDRQIIEKRVLTFATEQEQERRSLLAPL